MPTTVAVLDANILIPIVACDFLLTAFEHHLVEPVVSITVLEEVERTLIHDFPHLEPEALRQRVAAMRRVLDDQIIDTANVAAVPATINDSDRHVVAAALVAQADVVVTNDVALRSEITKSGLGLDATDGDSFSMRLWNESPAAVSNVITTLITKRHRRPVTTLEMAAQLHVHFPSMVDAWLTSS